MLRSAFITYIVLLYFSSAFSQTWQSTLTLNTASLTYNSDDWLDLYTNSDGIHIIIHQSSKIHHYLYDHDGLHIRHSQRASFTESPHRSRITGYDDKVYLVYKNDDYIYTQKSTNGGATWSTSIDEIELDYTTCNGMEVVADEDGVHIVWAEEQSTDHFETYYRKLTHTGTSWGDFKNVTDYSGHEGGIPFITTAPDINKIYVVYSDRDEDNEQVYPFDVRVRIKNNTSWLTPETVTGTWCWMAAIVADDEDLNLFTYTAGDRPGGSPYDYTLYFRNRDRDYTGGSWSNLDDVRNCGESPDDEYRIDIAKTQNGLIHFVYLGTFYRQWDGSNLSSEYTLGYSVPPKRISKSGNDVYCAWAYNDNGTLKFKLKQKDYDPPAPVISIDASGEHPVLSWDQVSLDAKEYKIYRKVVGIADWHYKATTSNISWTDNGVWLVDPLMTIYYKVRAYDQEDNESGYSNQVSCIGDAMNKPVVKHLEKINVAEQPNEHKLRHNYPNPFNPETTIEFDLPEESQVKLRVFNISGQEVANLLDAFIPAGTYNVEFNAEDLPSGFYFYQIRAGEFTDIKRMLLIK